MDSIITARTAGPINILSTRSIPGLGNFLLRPDLVPNVPLFLYGPQFPGGRSLNRSAFALPTGRQGNLGRNALRGFPLSQIDLSMRRGFPLGDRLKLQFRGDLFNVLN